MKRNEMLLRAMSNIRPRYIEDAGTYANAARGTVSLRTWKIGVGVTAAACAAVAAVVLFPRGNEGWVEREPESSAEGMQPAVTTEQTAESTSTDLAETTSARTTGSTAAPEETQTAAEVTASAGSTAPVQTAAAAGTADTVRAAEQTPESGTAAATSATSVTATASAASTSRATAASSATRRTQPTGSSTTSTTTTTTTTAQPLGYHDVGIFAFQAQTPYFQLFGADKRQPSWETCRFEQIDYDAMLNCESKLLVRDALDDDGLAGAELQTYYVETFWLMDLNPVPSPRYVLNLIYDLPQGSFVLGARSLSIDSDGILHAELAAYDNGDHDGRTASYQIPVCYQAGTLPEIKGVVTSWEYFNDTAGKDGMADSPVYQAFTDALLLKSVTTDSGYVVPQTSNLRIYD